MNPDLASEIDLAIARILIVQKRFDAANAVIARLPDNNAGRDHGLALLYFAEGNHAEADAALERLVEQLRTGPVDIRLAEVYAFRGMTDRAFETLRGVQAAVNRDAAAEASQLWSWQVELRVSPFMEPLHDDPRWRAVLVEPGTSQFLIGVHRADRRVLRSSFVSPSYDIGCAAGSPSGCGSSARRLMTMSAWPSSSVTAPR